MSAFKIFTKQVVDKYVSDFTESIIDDYRKMEIIRLEQDFEDAHLIPIERSETSLGCIRVSPILRAQNHARHKACRFTTVPVLRFMRRSRYVSGQQTRRRVCGMRFARPARI